LTVGKERVLYLGPDVPGGMSAVMRELRASPLADGFDIEFVSTYGGTGAVRRLLTFLWALVRLSAWSARRRGRIVHIHATVRGSMLRKSACVLVAKAFRRRVILHVHSGPGDIETFRAGLGRLGLAYVRRAFAEADVVLSVSTRSAKALSAAFGRAEIQVLPNPAPPPVAAIPRRAEPPLALFLGGFANRVKGGDVIVEALASRPPTGFEVVLSGPGELSSAGAALVESTPAVTWRGWLAPEEKDALLERASIFVLASTSEGLPMALLEAMSAGLAIVAADVGGVPDVVDADREALVFPPGDTDALGEDLARLAADPELRRRLGTAAHARAAGLGTAAIAAQIDRIYRTLAP
jgi:glycosyltransferase involved in cell wall biosynthesis